MNFGMKLIFCLWLFVLKYISVIQFIHMDLVRCTWTCQMEFPMLNMQYFKIELSFNADFLHMSSFLQKQQIDSVLSSSLTDWFLSFGPKVFLANQIAWFFT